MLWPVETVHAQWRHKKERKSHFSTPGFEKYPWKKILPSFTAETNLGDLRVFEQVQERAESGLRQI